MLGQRLDSLGQLTLAQPARHIAQRPIGLANRQVKTVKPAVQHDPGHWQFTPALGEQKNEAAILGSKVHGYSGAQHMGLALGLGLGLLAHFDWQPVLARQQFVESQFMLQGNAGGCIGSALSTGRGLLKQLETVVEYLLDQPARQPQTWAVIIER